VANRYIESLGAIYFCTQCGVYSINFWLPTIIKSSGIANPMAIGWLSAIPYLINSVGQCAGFLSPYLVGWIKDATHTTDLALYIPAGLMLVGVVLVLRTPGRIVNR